VKSQTSKKTGVMRMDVSSIVVHARTEYTIRRVFFIRQLRYKKVKIKMELAVSKFIL
jgi:hypothetical protein